MKLFFFFFSTSLFFLSAQANQTFQSGFERAKNLLQEGQRIHAIEYLDDLRPLAKTKSDLDKLVRTRVLFFEQFFLSESFQSYESAKGFSVVERWSDCLKELENVKLLDSENLFVLRQKGMCYQGAKNIELAEKTYLLILSFLPRDIDALLGLAEVQYLNKKPQDSLHILSMFDSKWSEQLTPYLSRFNSIKAKALESLEQNSKE